MKYKRKYILSWKCICTIVYMCCSPLRRDLFDFFQLGFWTSYLLPGQGLLGNLYYWQKKNEGSNYMFNLTQKNQKSTFVPLLKEVISVAKERHVVLLWGEVSGGRRERRMGGRRWGHLEKGRNKYIPGATHALSYVSGKTQKRIWRNFDMVTKWMAVVSALCI